MPIIIEPSPYRAGDPAPEVPPQNEAFSPEERQRRKEQAELDVLQDMLKYQAESYAWINNYRKNNQGRSAVNAGDEAREFYTERAKSMIAKWQGNDQAQRFLSKQTWQAGASGIAAMQTYGKRQQEAWKMSTAQDNFYLSAALASDPETPTEEAWKAFQRSEDLLRRMVRQKRNPENGRWEGGLNVDGPLAQWRQAYRIIELKKFLGQDQLDAAQKYLDDYRDDFGERHQEASDMLEVKRERTETLRRQTAAALWEGREDGIAQAMRSGDYGRLQQLERRLRECGQNREAASLAETRKILSRAGSRLLNGELVPLAEQARSSRQELEKLSGGEDPKKIAEAAGLLNRELLRRETAFQNDPAGYLAAHPLLQEEDLSAGERLRRTLELQRRIGAGLDFEERVLSRREALELQDNYDRQPDWRAKAALLRQQARQDGDYAARCMAEAALPALLVMSAPALEDIGEGQAARLAQAGEANWKDIPADAEERAEIRERVLSGPLLQSLQGLAETVKDPDKRTALRKLCERAAEGLEKFAALGGNLDALTDTFVRQAKTRAASILQPGAAGAEDAKRTSGQELNRPLDQTQERDLGRDLSLNLGQATFTQLLAAYERVKSAPPEEIEAGPHLAATSGSLSDAGGSQAHIGGRIPVRERLSEQERKQNLNTGWTINTDTTKEENDRYSAQLKDIARQGDNKPLTQAVDSIAMQLLRPEISLLDRYNMMVGFVVEQDPDDIGTAGTRKENVPLMLSLQGVPLATQRKVAAYRPNYGAYTNKEEADKRIYAEYMERFDITDLPEDLREETRALMAHGRAYARENRELLRTAYARWRTAPPNVRVQLLHELEAGFIQRFGVPGAKIDDDFITERPSFAWIELTDTLDNDIPKWTVTINKADKLFEDNSPEGFALALSSLPHELNHLRQCRFLREDRTVKNGKRMVNPSSLAINAAGNISFTANPWAYIVQPVELQSHLLQREVRKGILQAIK